MKIKIDHSGRPETLRDEAREKRLLELGDDLLDDAQVDSVPYLSHLKDLKLLREFRASRIIHSRSYEHTEYFDMSPCRTEDLYSD